MRRDMVLGEDPVVSWLVLTLIQQATCEVEELGLASHNGMKQLLN